MTIQDPPHIYIKYFTFLVIILYTFWQKLLGCLFVARPALLPSDNVDSRMIAIGSVR
jgi:hypothetical protein